MSEIAITPKPPLLRCYFYIFACRDADGYGEMADNMVELAATQPGFLGIESAREDLGLRSLIGQMLTP